MAYSRLVARVGIVGVAGLMLAVACGSDNPTMDGSSTAGQGGGSGGHAGSSTQGGSVNKAGSAGSAGQGGKAGSAGTGGGGNGGTMAGGTMAGGSGGEAPGGTANEGGGGAGGGEAGASGAGGAPELKTAQCTYGCMKDEDCVGGPVEVCDLDTHQCAAPPPQCGADPDCMPFLSQWFLNCMGNGDCDNGSVCVKWEDVGYCAVVPVVGQTPCDSGVPTMVPAIGGGDVSVCASEDPRCFSGACQPGCSDSSFGGCVPGFGDTCNKDTGKCDCSQGTECNSGKCGKDAQCVQCVTDDDCAPLAAYGQDKCMAGSCGCSAAGVCPDQGFANATVACQ